MHVQPVQVQPVPTHPAPGIVAVPPGYASPAEAQPEYAQPGVVPPGAIPPGYTQPGFPLPTEQQPRRKVGTIVTISILSVALVISIALFVVNMLRAGEAEKLVENQQQELDERQDIIDEQQELLDEKEVFGTAMNALVNEANALASLPYANIVDWDDYQDFAIRGWEYRWDADEVRGVTEEVEAARADLAAISSKAAEQAATNISGNVHEAVLDQLSGGYATAVFEDADSLCGKDVLACVFSDTPYVVHYDAADLNLEYHNDWIRTGVTYHEYAHVLQFTNPDATDTAVASFGGDYETMADCYALTFLEGWTLKHRVWINSYSWWDVSVGYGYTCNDTQRQAIRDWVDALGFEPRTISS